MFLAAPVFLVSIYVQLIMKSLILSQVYIERILHKYNLKATLTGNFYEKYGNYQNEFKTRTRQLDRHQVITSINIQLWREHQD